MDLLRLRALRCSERIFMEDLVAHYSAIGDTIPCDAPYSAIGFRGELFLRYPPCELCLGIAIGHFYGKKCGCSSESLRYHRKHSATGVLLHLSRDRGGYFGRVTKYGRLGWVFPLHVCLLRAFDKAMALRRPVGLPYACSSSLSVQFLFPPLHAAEHPHP